MTNQIKQFHNSEFGTIEVIMLDGKPYFPATECAKTLGYANTKDAIIRHCKGVVKYDLLTNGGKQAKNYISEGDLYRLIIRSKLPAAARFEIWVFDDVLPSIRKHGAYITSEVLEAAKQSQDIASSLFTSLQMEKKQSDALRGKVDKLAPKAQYCDLILQSEGVVQVSIIAKDYGMSAIQFNRLLHCLKIQFKVGSTWLLYKRYAGLNYTKSQTYFSPGGSSIVYTCWTQKGRMFLYEKLKSYGIVPLVEPDDVVVVPGVIGKIVKVNGKSHSWN